MSEEQTPPPETPGTSPPVFDYGIKPGGYQGPPPDKDAKTMGMLCHLLALAGLVIPLGNILGPLIIWLIKKDSSPFVDDQGKESLNFQITVLIAAAVCALLIIVLIGIVLLPLLGVLDVIFVILAAMKANEGIAYRYPFAIRLIK